MLDVMETFVYTLRELVQEQGCGYDFTIFENESTILLFWVGRGYDFTDGRRYQDVESWYRLFLS